MAKPQNSKSVEVVTITPHLAEELLSHNKRNRPIAARHVNRLERDMIAGNFRFNGDTIGIMADGTLGNGQHRLTACVRSGIPFETILVKGLDEADLLTIDTNRGRSTADNLGVAYGIPNAAYVALTARFLIVLGTQNAFAFLSANETNDMIKTHPGLLKLSSLVHGIQPATPALVGAIVYIGSAVQGHVERAEAFLRVLRTGIPDYEDCAAHRLREVLLRNKLRHARIEPTRRNNLYVNAWDKFVNRTPVKMLKPGPNSRMDGWNEVTMKEPPKFELPDPNGEEGSKAQ